MDEDESQAQLTPRQEAINYELQLLIPDAIFRMKSARLTDTTKLFLIKLCRPFYERVANVWEAAGTLGIKRFDPYLDFLDRNLPRHVYFQQWKRNDLRLPDNIIQIIRDVATTLRRSIGDALLRYMGQKNPTTSTGDVANIVGWIYPWDVLRALQADAVLSLSLHIPSGVTLPVVIHQGLKSTKLDLDFETAAGLVIASGRTQTSRYEATYPYTLNMFEEAVDQDETYDPRLKVDTKRFEPEFSGRRDPPRYSLVQIDQNTGLKGKTLVFHSASFVRGLDTAAAWTDKPKESIYADLAQLQPNFDPPEKALGILPK